MKKIYKIMIVIVIGIASIISLTGCNEYKVTSKPPYYLYSLKSYEELTQIFDKNVLIPKDTSNITITVYMTKKYSSAEFKKIVKKGEVLKDITSVRLQFMYENILVNGYISKQESSPFDDNYNRELNGRKVFISDRELKYWDDVNKISYSYEHLGREDRELLCRYFSDLNISR